MTSPAGLGVLVARFQVPELDAGARELIGHLMREHTRCIVFLGVSPLRTARFDPLDYATRREMLIEAFPTLEVRPIADVRSDAGWSAALDQAIGVDHAVIYGSQAGLIDRYRGRHATRATQGGPLTPPATPDSGEEAAFRRGVLWATQARYPAVLATVDVAIFSPDHTKLLLARKPGEPLLRFVGGFADPDDATYEHSARREAKEETGLDVSDPVYVASFRIVDWRYVNERDCVKTHLFTATSRGSEPVAQDDIEEIRWCAPEVPVDELMPEHRDLLVATQQWHAQRFT